jgi:hypothetical protein
MKAILRGRRSGCSSFPYALAPRVSLVLALTMAGRTRPARSSSPCCPDDAAVRAGRRRRPGSRLGIEAQRNSSFHEDNQQSLGRSLHRVIPSLRPGRRCPQTSFPQDTGSLRTPGGPTTRSAAAGDVTEADKADFAFNRQTARRLSLGPHDRRQLEPGESLAAEAGINCGLRPHRSIRLAPGPIAVSFRQTLPTEPRSIDRSRFQRVRRLVGERTARRSKRPSTRLGSFLKSPLR